MKFPTKQVQKITGIEVIPAKGDTFCQWNGGTISQLKELVEIGDCNPEDKQNNSPAIQELIDILGPIQDKITLEGYVIFPPRVDARVSVDGFSTHGLTKLQNEKLLKALENSIPDEHNEKIKGRKVYSRFWWD